MRVTRRGRKIPIRQGEFDRYGYALLAGTPYQGLSLFRTPKGRFAVWQNAYRGRAEGERCILIFGPKISEELARGQFEILRKEVGISEEKALNTIRLGGIWEGVKITEEDIKEAREELLKKLEERW